MNTFGYPSVNWSRGCLVKHESVESFAARFCELNKISVKQFFDYLGATIGGAWRQGWGLSDEDTAKISTALQEPLAILDSVLSPYEGIGDAFGKYCGVLAHQNEIRYCPSCAREGFHSHFHTLLWLERCPFDGMELITHSYYAGTDGSANRVGALTEILRTQWPGWPGGVPDAARKQRHLAPLFLTFQRWVLDTNWVTHNLIEMRLVQRGTIFWRDDANCLNRVNQIRALLPPPGGVIGCFAKAVSASPNLVPLDATVNSTVRDLTSKYEFSQLIWFYRICRNSAPAKSAFRDSLDSELAALRNCHVPCRCRWGHSMSEGWRSVHPDEWPHWDLKCPYEVACDFLEANYGDFRCGQTRRAADKEFFRYIECAEKFASAGLTRHHGVPEGLSEVMQRCVHSWQPWVEWTGPLEEFFDAVLNAGLVSDITWLYRWLADVENSASPQVSPFPYPNVGLINDSGSLAILSWQHPTPCRAANI